METCPQCMGPVRVHAPSISDADDLTRFQCLSCAHTFALQTEDEPDAAWPTSSVRPATDLSVDPTLLRSLAARSEGNGSALVTRVVKSYLTNSPKLLSALREAVEADDARSFVSVAHSFKTSSAYIGAARLSSLCKDLESLGRRGSCEGARVLAYRICEEFESVQEELATEHFEDRALKPVTEPKVSKPQPPPEATFEAPLVAESGGEVDFLAHVLIAEDNNVNLQVVVAVLESMGCRVDSVANGQQALDQLERSSAYDLLFMDCQMPIMDGLAATSAIRAREVEALEAAGGAPVRRLPIVALTAHGLESDRKDCLAAGMDDHLTKPFTKAELKNAIDNAKQGAWATRSAPTESSGPDLPPPAPRRQKSSGSAAARPLPPQSRASAANSAGRASKGRPAPRRKPTTSDGPLPPLHQMPMGAPAASPPPSEKRSATAIALGTLEQKVVSLLVHSRRLIRDLRGVMRWAIGGGVTIVLLVLVNLLWQGPEEPLSLLAAQSPGTAIDRPVPAPGARVWKPPVVADRRTFAAPREVEPDEPIATVPAHTATPAPAPKAAPKPVAKRQTKAKPVTVAKPRTVTKPRTAVKRAAKPTARATSTRSPKTRPTPSPRSSERKKAVPAQTKPRATGGGQKVTKEPSKRSQSSKKEVQNGWDIEH